MQPFYLYGRLIAVLEQGALAHGQIPWLELYYPRGFLPWVGLREPLRKHMQSVLPFLERRERAERHVDRLNSLANALQKSEEPPQDPASFDTWCTRYLSHDRSPKPELPHKSTPRDAPLYAQGYLDERQTLQPTRPSLPPDQEIWQFCWDYHQGRLLTWNIAGNDSRLPPGAQAGIKDRRAVTTEDPAGGPGHHPPSPHRPCQTLLDPRRFIPQFTQPSKLRTTGSPEPCNFLHWKIRFDQGNVNVQL